ncbi:MAG: glycosyltransferase [Hyphomonadaceae bacterium]|nr:glycosyltransferase [Hyphomonadaceae bacterium]
MKLGWLLQSGGYNLASNRYRCFHIAYGLGARGHENRFFEAPTDAELSDLDVLIIIKRLDSAALAAAAAARKFGVPVVYDLCDDVTSRGYRADGLELGRISLAGLGAVVDTVTTTGPELAARLRPLLPAHLPIVLIPDVSETPDLLAASRPLWKEPVRTDSREPRRSFGARLLWAVRHPRRTMRVVSNRLEMIFSRAVYVITHPEWAWRRTAKAMHGLSTGVVGRTAGRLAYISRHPDWLLRRIHHRVMSVPLLAKVWFVLRHPRASLRSIRRKLAREPLPAEIGKQAVGQTSMTAPGPPPEKSPRRVLWFGNAGAPNSNSGMLSLLPAIAALRAVHAEAPIELVIVSNDRERYEALRGVLGVPSRFCVWSNTAVHEELTQSDVALLTTGDDDFSLVKSANRAVLALSAGVPVVASPSPALDALKHCVATDYKAGLRRYLTDAAAAAADVAAAQAVIATTYALDPVVNLWEGALQAASTRGKAASARRRARPTITFLVDLVQDLDVLLPVIDAARGRGLKCYVIVSWRALAQQPRLAQALIDRGIGPTMVEASGQLDARYLRDSDALVMAAESSLAAHRLAHGLAVIARGLGLRCASIQHGLEMEGLTMGAAQPVTFASDVIFGWGPVESLPSFVPADVRGRVVPVGRPAPPAPTSVPHEGVRVGVFENLHWDRYTPRYRRAFEQSLEEAARRRPDVTFVLRPHPAGRWTTRQPGRFDRPNIQLLNAHQQPIEPVIAGVDAVITSPSTVALDAVQAGKQTAVFAGDIDMLPAYEPLPLLRSAKDWLQFLDAAPAGGANAAAHRAFLARTVVAGDASARILDALCADIWPPVSSPLTAPHPPQSPS